MNDYKAISNRPKLRSPRIRLTDYNQKVIEVMGSCILQAQVRGRKHSVLFNVVKDGDSLLGANTSEGLGLVKRIRAIYPEEESKDIEQSAAPDGTKPLPYLPFEYHIKIKEGAQPVIKPSRRIPVATRAPLKMELKRMTDIDVIYPVNHPTEMVSEIVVTNKPDGSIRVCLDPQELNKIIEREHYQLPTREEIFADVQGAKYFSKLDGSQAFWQIRLSPESQELTTFNTPFGRFAYKRLPYGICSGPEVFHKYMEMMFEGLSGTRVYLDDILVWGRTKEEHDQRLEAVKARINQYGLLMNWKKCELGKAEIQFIGEILTAEGIRPNPERIQGIKDMAKPKNVAGVQRLLGSVNFVGKFIPNLTERCKHIRSLLCKKTEWNWGEEHDREWEWITETLASDPVLSYYDPSWPTKVSTDSSKDGLGAVLLQLHGKNWKPVAYASRSLTDAETRYAQIEKECLGLVFGCQRFHHYVYGLKGVILETDHKPLLALAKKSLNDLSPRIQRLMLKLQRYNVTLSWLPGKYLYIPDALSRACKSVMTTTQQSIEDRAVEVQLRAQVKMVYESIPASKVMVEKIVSETAKDEVLQSVMRCVTEGWANGQCQAYSSFKDELYIMNGLLMRGNRIVVPSSLRRDMLGILHEGHLGVEKQRRMARDVVYWPNINADIEAMTQECSACNKFRPAQGKETWASEDSMIDLDPWQKVGVDLFFWNGSDYLIVIDYKSNFPEISLLTKTTSDQVILHLKSIFARHGIPETMVSDNGPQFDSSVFKQFAREWGFQHETSSPRYPQANGKAERGVGIVKSLLNKAKESQSDPYLALLAYRQAPRENIDAPAKVLMGRELRSKVPQIKVRKKAVKRMSASQFYGNQIRLYNDHAKDLPQLRPGDVTRVKGVQGYWDTKATVQEQVGPRSYRVLTESGSALRRNRRHLLKTKETVDREVPVSFPSGATQRQQETPLWQKPSSQDETQHQGNAQEQELDSSVKQTMDTNRSAASKGLMGTAQDRLPNVTRSGRIVKPVTKLNL